eukprot:43951-Eustigmatos_ZCMA.PRE.1
MPLGSRYLAEYAKRRGVAAEINEQAVPLVVPDVLQQVDNDCGVFVLMFGELVLKLVDDISLGPDLPPFTSDEFTLAAVAQKRVEMRELFRRSG